MKISLCVNTYRRAHIYDTLLSVSRQSLPSDVEIEYIVSDNDAEGSGQAHVNRFTMETGLAVNYNIVPEKNIAIARNDAVRRATGEWVLFMDDDEVAEPGWIAAMLDCARKFDADLVQGPVISTFAPGVEPWIVNADPMSKWWGPSGTRRNMASTCNLLVRAALLKQSEAPFNFRFGKMGNDDGEMSYRLHKGGAKIVVCNECPVSEIIPADRGNVPYLKARNRGFGQAYLYLIRGESSGLRMAKVFAVAVAKSAAYLLASELVRGIDKSRWLKLRIQYWINLGKLDYFRGASKIENY